MLRPKRIGEAALSVSTSWVIVLSSMTNSIGSCLPFASMAHDVSAIASPSSTLPLSSRLPSFWIFHFEPAGMSVFIWKLCSSVSFSTRSLELNRYLTIQVPSKPVAIRDICDFDPDNLRKSEFSNISDSHITCLKKARGTGGGPYAGHRKRSIERCAKRHSSEPCMDVSRRVHGFR